MLALDVLKAYLPTVVVLRTMGTLPALVAGLAVVLGHVFSPFLGGKGGKGVAAALGAILAIAPWVALVGVALFAVAKVVLPYVGEASVVTTTGLLVVGVLGAAGVLPLDRSVAGLARPALAARAVAAPAQHRRVAGSPGPVTCRARRSAETGQCEIRHGGLGAAPR